MGNPNETEQETEISNESKGASMNAVESFHNLNESSQDSVLSSESIFVRKEGIANETHNKREIKILPKPSIGLSIGSIVTNGPGKPVTNTYLIVTNLPPPPQPNLHIEVPPGKRKSQYNCPECSLVFSIKTGLTNHLNKEHNKKKLYHCEMCNKDFCRKPVLARHVKIIHEQQQNYKCPKCEESFNLKKKLITHIENEHKEEKLFSCPECGIEFKLRNTMMNHIKLEHKKLKSFQCDQCNARYSWKKSLNLHIDSTHNNLQYYKCDLCNSAFRWKTSLVHHYKAAHKRTEKVQCDECSSTFTSEKRLLYHKKKIHFDEKIGIEEERMEGRNNPEEVRKNEAPTPNRGSNFHHHESSLQNVIERSCESQNHKCDIAEQHSKQTPPDMHNPPLNYLPLPYVPYNPYYTCN